MVKIIIVIDRLRTEADQHTPHSNLLEDVGGKIGVEFLDHTHRSWMKWLAKCSPSLSRNSFAEKVVRVMKTLFLDKRSVLADGAEPIGGTLVNESRDIIIWGPVLTGPTPLGRKFLPFFPDIGDRTQTASRVMKGNGTKVAHPTGLDNMKNA